MIFHVSAVITLDRLSYFPMGVLRVMRYATLQLFFVLQESLFQKHEPGPNHIEIGKAHHMQCREMI